MENVRLEPENTPTSTCVKCRGTGFVYDEKDALLRCDACALRAKQERIHRLLGASQMGPRFRDKGFEAIKPTPGIKRALETAKEYVERFEDKRRQGQGLALVGGVGVGKTLLASAILHELIQRRQLAGVFVSSSELLEAIRRTYDSESRVSTSELTDLVKQAEFLALDDLGVERPTEWVMERLYQIVNYRYEHLLPTLLTSNLDWEGLEGRVGERIVSRLMETTTAVLLEGDDFRKRES